MKTIHQMPTVQPRESNFDLDYLISKLSAINTKESGVNNDITEAILCLANEIKKIKDNNRSANSDSLLTVDHLMSIHNNLERWQAALLLEYCKAHTIRHKECYGDGSMMYPKWVKKYGM